VEVRRASERFVTRSPGVETRHCFSFGRHYDPANVGHGPLLVHDEHLLGADGGFPSHPHRDLEVVSWVLEGALAHEQDGARVVVPAGGMQRTTAGTGVVHAETAAGVPTRFVQLWLTPSAPGLPPSYEQVAAPTGGGLVQVLPPVGSGASVHVGQLAAGELALLPGAAVAHLFVADGALRLGGVLLAAGDAVRLTAAGDLRAEALEPARVLLVTADGE
jgi:redox-sensitive bicupin YhaK (pirin superfamily)